MVEICFKFLPHNHTNKLWFHVSAIQFFENIVEKREIARNDQFLLFYPFGELSAIFKFKIVVCKHLILEESKICRLGKG